MQEKMRKLVEESTKKKKEKKKNKVKKKPVSAGPVSNASTLPNSSSSGKPGAHPPLTKTNSLVDSVDDSIASVVSETSLHPGANKALNATHNNMAASAGANASNVQPKTAKTKGEDDSHFHYFNGMA